MAARDYTQFASINGKTAPWGRTMPPGPGPATNGDKVGPDGKGKAPRWTPAGSPGSPAWKYGSTFYVAKSGITNKHGGRYDDKDDKDDEAFRRMLERAERGEAPITHAEARREPPMMEEEERPAHRLMRLLGLGPEKKRKR